MNISLDTWLWILGASIPFGMGALGGHLSSDRPVYRWIFWIFGLVGVAVIATAGVRNQRAQTSLQIQLTTIQKNTEKPTTFTVNPTPVVVSTPNPTAKVAKLNFTFLPLDTNETLVTEISKPIVDGHVSVQFTAKNVGFAQANNGQIWIQVCDGCKYGESPAGSTEPTNEPLVRRKIFEHLHIGVYFEPTLLDIIPPAGIATFTLAFKYACDECPPLDNQHPQKLRVYLIAP
jgi:hypothetical protein